MNEAISSVIVLTGVTDVLSDGFFTSFTSFTFGL